VRLSARLFVSLAVVAYDWSDERRKFSVYLGQPRYFISATTQFNVFVSVS